ncbi:hypothetical protein HMN09_01083900 [Mycena chlorophos]|uniref:Uncharacterized protein n=1 Tax=Mycena chlorophos TaxID=658473 RepID=A0A8H6SE23_MYCCL|nr:hypothetical protein HMN09_01083900 [Mycena chlorophos]
MNLLAASRNKQRTSSPIPAPQPLVEYARLQLFSLPNRPQRDVALAVVPSYNGAEADKRRARMKQERRLFPSIAIGFDPCRIFGNASISAHDEVCPPTSFFVVANCEDSQLRIRGLVSSYAWLLPTVHVFVAQVLHRPYAVPSSTYPVCVAACTPCNGALQATSGCTQLRRPHICGPRKLPPTAPKPSLPFSSLPVKPPINARVR